MTAMHQFTQRTFLKAAAAAITAPAIAPSTAFGLGGRAAPSERITVAFIGAGKVANNYHLRELLNFPDVEALCVCEVDKTRREHARKVGDEATSKWLDRERREPWRLPVV